MLDMVMQLLKFSLALRLTTCSSSMIVSSGRNVCSFVGSQHESAVAKNSRTSCPATALRWRIIVGRRPNACSRMWCDTPEAGRTKSIIASSKSHPKILSFAGSVISCNETFRAASSAASETPSGAAKRRASMR